jgi:tetratricopeptide (TPR) repeat protein
MLKLCRVSLTLLLIVPLSSAQETHDHGTPEKLGKVSFPTSCAPAVQQQFNRGVALLHSFAYSAAEKTFETIAQQDPHCAMAHWGAAMSYFRQLWEPQILPATTSLGQKHIQLAEKIGARTERERQFIQALALIYRDADTVPYNTRASNYEHAMSALAQSYSSDVEAQVFYALAILANESPTDKTHAKQKQALAILEPLDRAYPDHPGIPHYLIHACDNAELASTGLPAARAYSLIAPSAPHALHMPSHIFTQLGLWDDSIASNLASQAAAHHQGNTREELHAMDYLVYAYLQTGRDQQAYQVLRQLKDMPKPSAGDFAVSYAFTTMPVRYAVERHRWAEAAVIVPSDGAPPQVVAIAIWSRGLGLTHTGHASEAAVEIDKLSQLEAQLRATDNDYWATQVEILKREVMAWSTQANNKPEEAATLMRAAADQEDAIEKLPVTPGPIIPAREQLGYLLLEQNHPAAALKEFQTALINAPGRRAALQGASKASALSAQSHP